MDGWETIFLLGRRAYFQVLLRLDSGKVHDILFDCIDFFLYFMLYLVGIFRCLLYRFCRAAKIGESGWLYRVSCCQPQVTPCKGGMEGWWHRHRWIETRGFQWESSCFSDVYGRHMGVNPKIEGKIPKWMVKIREIPIKIDGFYVNFQGCSWEPKVPPPMPRGTPQEIIRPYDQGLWKPIGFPE